MVFASEPLHYTALFSHTVGSDVVVSMYDGNQMEVECKYTQFVNVHSRPVYPRVDMAPLAKARSWHQSELGVNGLCVST